MVRRFIIAVVLVFIAWSALDFLVHGLVLKSSYAATSRLWRPMTDMKMSIMYFSTIIDALCFVSIYALLIRPKILANAVSYGLLYGIGAGLSMGFGTYSVMPIPFHMALAWLFGALIQTVAAGFILGAVMKEPRQSVPI